MVQNVKSLLLGVFVLSELSSVLSNNKCYYSERGLGIPWQVPLLLLSARRGHTWCLGARTKDADLHGAHRGDRGALLRHCETDA